MSNESVEDQRPVVTAKPKLAGWERREKRRKSRKRFEEVLGWIIVPALIYVAYLAYQAVGGIPEEWISPLTDIFHALLNRRG